MGGVEHFLATYDSSAENPLETIRITPEKWTEKTFGKLEGNFWVVAAIGTTVIWYNDIEEGVNCSKYSKYGKIDQYWCNQDQLE